VYVKLIPTKQVFLGKCLGLFVALLYVYQICFSFVVFLRRVSSKCLLMYKIIYYVHSYVFDQLFFS